ncbi:MAG: DUF6089 family protein, partial [Bacteroidota bacterium]
MKKLYIILFSCIFLLCGYTDGNSQRQSFKKRQKKIRQNNRRISSFRGRKTGVFKNKRYNYIAVGVNAFNYFGDLAPLSRTASTDLGLTRSGFGVTFGHRFGPRYTLRGSLNYGTIRGDDFDSADPTDSDARFRYVRNLQFRNRITELAVTGMFDLFKNESSYISRVQFTPYIFFGAAVFIHNPQALVPEGLGLPDEGSWVDLEPLGTEGQYSNLDVDDANFGIDTYSLFQIAIPVGIGIRYRLNQILDLSLEAGVRYTWTDYLDDVSASYVDPGVFQGSDAALARALSDRSQEATAAVSGDQRQM